MTLRTDLMEQTLNGRARSTVLQPERRGGSRLVDVRRLCASRPSGRPSGDDPQSPLAMARRKGRHVGREPGVPIRPRLQGPQHPGAHVEETGRRAGEARPAAAQSGPLDATVEATASTSGTGATTWADRDERNSAAKAHNILSTGR